MPPVYDVWTRLKSHRKPCLADLAYEWMRDSLKPTTRLKLLDLKLLMSHHHLRQWHSRGAQLRDDGFALSRRTPRGELSINVIVTCSPTLNGSELCRRC